jgi:LacI family transcriptional regulator
MSANGDFGEENMTIKDLAIKTGYSVGTVSRVLNNQSHVSEQARRTILNATRESGFQLNANARQLKQQHSNSILVICKGRANELYEALLIQLRSRISQTEHPLIVDYLDESDNVVQHALAACPIKKPLGIIFLGGNRQEFLRDFDKITRPCVLVTGHGQDLPFPNLSSVTADDVQAGRLAIGRLIELGHRNIAVLGGDRDNSDITSRRYEGCLEAFESHGVSFCQEQSYATARYTYEDAWRATAQLLQRNPDFTALFAMSDVMAIGAIRAMKDAGKRVPEDVSVIGVDGLSMGRYMIPRLSTVSQSVTTLANRAADLLMQAIETKNAGIHELVTVTLENRESTANR